MRADTATVTINAPKEEVFALVAAPRELPRWAIAFAKSISETDDGRWTVELASGARLPIRYVTDPGLGVVDFHMEPEPGTDLVAHARVLANGESSEVVFTQFQGDAPDEVFEAQVVALRHELTVLKALAEARCPR